MPPSPGPVSPSPGEKESSIRLYYSDSYLRQFTATVLETVTADGRPGAVLDRTAFYPASGGQPHDTGRLGSAGVVNVTVRESDQGVIHWLDAPLEPGPVQGVIDWPRRFDHMQQHTGQHILSRAFIEVAGAETIGFHLGGETVTIDLAAAGLPDERIAAAEALANEIITASLPVRAWFPEPGELAGLSLRKAPDVAGPVRLVAIGEFDLTPCGGTHVKGTGEIGLVAVLRAERLKRGTRIEFRSGLRARSDYAGKNALVRELAGLLTCAPEELAPSITRMRDSLQEARRELSRLRERELDQEATTLLATGTPADGLRLVVRAWPDRPVEELRALALRLTSGPGTVALLAAGGARTQLVFARSESVAQDLSPTFRTALEELGGGRGGGTRIMQGTAGPASPEELEPVLARAAHRLVAAP